MTQIDSMGKQLSLADGEPAFTFVGHDPLAPLALRAYADICEAADCGADHVDAIRSSARQMELWQANNPDLVKHRPGEFSRSEEIMREEQARLALEARDYDNLTVDQLKDILRDRDLPVSGTKEELIERLNTDDATDG